MSLFIIALSLICLAVAYPIYLAIQYAKPVFKKVAYTTIEIDVVDQKDFAYQTAEIAFKKCGSIMESLDICDELSPNSEYFLLCCERLTQLRNIRTA